MKSLPHVTTIIREAGLMPPVWDEEAFEAKAVLGTTVHALCARRRASDGPAGDYARSFLRWLEETGARVIDAEVKVTGGGYVGRIDLFAVWNNQRWILDIKTGPPHRWHGVQLAAYSSAVSRDHPKIIFRRGVLWLSPARAKLYCEPPIISPGDSAAWEACLMLWRWRNTR